MEALSALSGASAEELRGAQLETLFRAIDGVSFESAPLVTSLVGRAFEGEGGLEALRSSSVLPYVVRGLEHPDEVVRSQTIVLLVRFATSAADLALLRSRDVLPIIAAAVGDRSLKVSQSAATFFEAAAAAGAEQLRALLDAPTVHALLALSEKAEALRLRAAALAAEMAAKGDTQFALCVVDLGLLAPLLELWRAGDPLVRINVIEVFGTLARCPSGFAWLRSTGVSSELCHLVDCDEGDDVVVALQRPSALHCLAELVEGGRAPGLLDEERLVERVWPLLTAAAAAGEHSSALALLRAAASTPGGAAQVLRRGVEGVQPLPRLMRSHDERTKVGAFSVAAQLCATAASGNVELPPLLPALQAIIAGAATSPSTTAADAAAQLASQSFSDGLRSAALQLLLALAALSWGAVALATSESTLELLLGGATAFPVGPPELRQKHAVARALLEVPAARDALAAQPPLLEQLEAYVVAGPFAPQRSRNTARMAAPLTL